MAEIEAAAPQTPAAIEEFRVRYLGTKNVMKDLFAGMKDIEPARKGEFGKVMNALKTAAEEKFEALKASLEAVEGSKGPALDLSAPGEPFGLGSRHPVSLVMNEVVDIFARMGFTVAESREIEDEWHNFTALNTPEDHPSRDMQDTYYVRGDWTRVLRSQTSTAQVHVMENQKPPIRIICPGRVYRNETISARAHCQFHQVEGLYVAENVGFADLKQTLLYFANEMFGQGTKIRLRPSYFPFTEISAEVDVSCFICNAKGCNVCKHSGWVEILGCGMVDPAVLTNCGIDPEKFTGFAFGMGVERIAMLRYRINDIRLLFENDVRFLKQFTPAI